ncbi:MAG: GNAT family N-acetyltransferase [Betaproteobacteria bacterium]|nr:GNAT family N-acetyltransferase [Betaproteobacteria bacterium]NBT75772.1 GNAT family N-acetyltransferase [Betaproteobacteria bacterium]NBY14113.1 GNAT family N-acetyltransferase [Betaproteobacteria bacterium]NCA16575.1 GNAT family N-acetyltransferase [Betaproteobacteria bacterium]NDF04631.1 GNAT family N-acetyltransferase [Betaproteobacteria bacterium]
MNCPLCEFLQGDPVGDRVWEDERLCVIQVTDAQLPGFWRVIWKAHVAEMSDLSEDDARSMMQAVLQVEAQLRRDLNPDKINLASFGNQVPHLHWHVMARWKTDPWWPNPIWAPSSPVQARGLPQGRTLRVGDWMSLQNEARIVREVVFVREQGVPAADEWEQADAYCRHVTVTHEDEVLATGRLMPDGRLGRMAVLAAHRREGLGREVLNALLHEGRRLGLRAFYLHAQVHAIAFYERAGFVAVGSDFDECGMAHRLMCLQDET